MKAAQQARRLDARIEAFDKIKTNTSNAFHRPGSTKKSHPEGVLERNRRRTKAGIHTNLPSYT